MPRQRAANPFPEWGRWRRPVLRPCHAALRISTKWLRTEWRRGATPLHDAGLQTLADRAALDAYCQAYSLWFEAKKKLRETPSLLKTPNGHVQQSPWLTAAN